MSPSRREFGRIVLRSGAYLGVILAAGCSGGSYAGTSGSPVAIPTNVVGKSNTSGISAGAAISAPDNTPTPKG